MPNVFATIERDGKPPLNLVEVSLDGPVTVGGLQTWGGTYWTADGSFTVDLPRIRLRLADGRTGEALVTHAEVRSGTRGASSSIYAPSG